MTKPPFDALTYVLWLHWRLRCLEGPPESFERLFQAVADRALTGFVKVRPYGSIGDRKVDGLHWGSGTAYQVYSPDEMKQAETRAKIEEDLAGAVRHWGSGLKKWVFVYNTRRGLAPDVLGMLREQQAKYPGLAIEPLSDAELWRMAESLPRQDLVELLGPPPPGYEGLFPISKALSPAAQKRLKDGRFIVVQDIMSPINVRDVLKAIKPAKPLGPPLLVRPGAWEGAWQLAADYQQALVDDAITRSREQLPRFAVFSLAPIPLAIHLGFLLSDRVEVEPFQFDRDRRTWLWPELDRPADLKFEVVGVPEKRIEDPVEVAVRVSLSARVTAKETQAVTGGLPVEVDLQVANPDVMWLVSREQLVALSGAIRGVLSRLRTQVPNCSRIHLFYAGPTGGAIVTGQAINPRMNPPVVLHEYHRQREPRYQAVLTLA